jgi:hypothetical protein
MIAEHLEIFAKKINRGLEAGTKKSTQFALNAPYTATVKTRTGSYRKLPMIGMEVFTTESAYVGKSGKLIVVFKPLDMRIASKYAFMEMPAEQAREFFTGFNRFMDELINEDFDEQVREFQAEAGRQEREERFAERSSRYDESFGSWS